MQVKSIANCSPWNILQYFRPSLNYHLSLRSFLFIFEWPFYTGVTVNYYSYQWDTKLADIEEVSYEFATEELTKNATLADLLTHKTGLSTSLDYAFIGGYPPGITRELLGR